jgi:dethiobiotin synthetase
LLLHGVFVTATDTGVGKTVVAAGLMHRFRRSAPVRYWKPIQTGAGDDDDTATVRRLAGCRPSEILDEGVRLPRPVSPHLAARLAGQPIEVPSILELAAKQPASDRWVVEGAGGVLVPVNDTTLMIDLIVRLELPAVIVARSGLGTINHTLLTIRALRHRSIQVPGVVMVGPRDAENRRAIEAYGGVAVLGELPCMNPLTPEALGRWATTLLDPEGRLAESFA